MNKNIWDTSTQQEKIDMLNLYYIENKETFPKSANLAKMMSEIIYKAVKINAEEFLFIIDNIVKQSSSFIIQPTTPKTYERKIGHVTVLAKFKPKIDKFNPVYAQLEQVTLLEKYINSEFEKLKKNTIIFTK